MPLFYLVTLYLVQVLITLITSSLIFSLFVAKLRFQLFAASFPLAPLMALVTTALDIRIDAWRLLWIYKRPIAHMAQDIGTDNTKRIVYVHDCI